MRWYFPAWNGDHRLVSVDKSTYRDADPETSCVLEVSDPTVRERELLGNFLKVAVKKKWTKVDELKLEKVGDREEQKILLDVSLADAGDALVKILKPKTATLTAVSYENGELRVSEKERPEKDAKAAASVKRHTPCCPQCFVGAVDRASECLLDFLTPEEHESWASKRYIVVEGGLSKHRYVLAHRRSPMAARIGRMCFDLDDNVVMHFHDNTVPPEEEVLAAKLILEHREPWLRNEATLYDKIYGGAEHIFKNPFGGYMDGTESAGLAQTFGHLFRPG